MPTNIPRSISPLQRPALIEKALERVSKAEARANRLADALQFGRNAAASASAGLKESSLRVVMIRSLVQSAGKHGVSADAPLRMNSSGAVKPMGTFKTMFTWAQNKQDKALAKSFGDSRVTLRDLQALRAGQYNNFIGEANKMEFGKPVELSVHHAAALQADLGNLNGRLQIELEARLSEAELARAHWELGELLRTNPVNPRDPRSGLEKLLGANGRKREPSSDGSIF